ncbi:MAG: winged helix-turn-helix domain-containing protein [Nitrososphaerota archaeon]|nr:winged helix-turn-helix domain-containing protein [Candidatus Bathyarchaeota archaeon]MDW8022665.1 winged helix-turn-helix domain-containing protein [Nitrososphaerota archaeon]
MLAEEEIRKVSNIFGAIGNTVRFKILMLVNESERPLHIKAVAKILKKDYAAVYRHVKVLEKSGLIRIYEVGRSRVLQAQNAEAIKKLVEVAKTVR